MKRIIKLEFRKNAKEYIRRKGRFYRKIFTFHVDLDLCSTFCCAQEVIWSFYRILFSFCFTNAHTRRTPSTKRMKFLLSAMPQTHTEIWMFRKNTALTIREPKTFEPFPEINLIVVDRRRIQQRWRTFLSDIRLLAAEVLSLFVRIGQNIFLVDTEIWTVAQDTECCGRRARE